jgi:signal transduction histidine kinase
MFKKGRLLPLQMGILFSLVSLVFIILIVIMLLAGTAFYIMGMMPREGFLYLPYFSVLLISVVLGMIIMAIGMRITLRPFRELIGAVGRIKAGDFRVRVSKSRIRELNFLVDNFNSMAEELESMEIMRTDFVRNVSHEFKTPLGSIKGYAGLLKKGGLERSLENEYLDIILDEAERLTTLTGNVLLLSKLEGSEHLTDLQRFSLDEEIRAAILLLEPAFGKKHIELNADLETLEYYGSRDLLHQVWLNLLGNAFKFTAEGGRVSIRAQKRAAAIEVEISDSGKGIAPEDIRHIFDKFYQADTSHATQGNGLGLPLVKRIVELHQGRVLVESELNRGTTVRVSLP